MPGNEKKWTSDYIKEYSQHLQKYQADIAFIQNKLQSLKNILNENTTPLLQQAVSATRRTLSYEDIHLLEIQVQTILTQKFPIFRNIPILQEKLSALYRFAAQETKKLSAAQTLLEKEKACGLHKLETLCQEYQTYLLKKLGADAETPIEKAFEKAQQVATLKTKAKSYHDKFIKLDQLRNILSLEPRHQLNNNIPPEKRRLEFEKMIVRQAEFFGTRSDNPLFFKDSEAGMNFLKGVSAILKPAKEEKSKLRKTRS